EPSTAAASRSPPRAPPSPSTFTQPRTRPPLEQQQPRGGVTATNSGSATAREESGTPPPTGAQPLATAFISRRHEPFAASHNPDPSPTTIAGIAFSGPFRSLTLVWVKSVNSLCY
ncbi:hypothetical protein Dimus_018378, partial [Dionaea muscipula]